MDGIIYILLFIVGFLVGTVILYYVIKSAIRDGINESYLIRNRSNKSASTDKDNNNEKSQ